MIYLENDDRDFNYAKYDDILCDISSEVIKLTLLIPKNLKEEKEKFFSNDKYNPQFKYKKCYLENQIKLLDDMRFPNTILGNTFDRARVYLLNFAKLIQTRGTDDFKGDTLYGCPEKELIDEANRILKFKKRDIYTRKIFYDYQVKEELLYLLQRYGLYDWKIKLREDLSTTVSVVSSTKQICIKKDLIISKRHLEKIKVHEIDTHVLRGENGKNQEFKIFGIGIFPNYLSIEEGLAGYNEWINGLSGDVAMRTFATHVIATDNALRMSFRELFNFLLPIMQDEEKTFKEVMRVKRGMGDTSKPGGFIKDHVYLEGKYVIQKYVREGGDLKKLYAGKISLDELKLIDMGILKPAKHLPSFYK